tara:strand:+ start:139 stop:393 length:255 start_codon:yes stop_codon:yes gene_type:complete
MIINHSSIETGYQRVQNRGKNIKVLNKRINKYILSLNEKKKNELIRCYQTRNVDFKGLNRLNIPYDLRSPVANDCFKRVLGINF